jgi:hypothetical protein
VQAVSVFGFGFKSKNNRANIGLILKILTGKNEGRVLSTFIAQSKVRQCKHYIRFPIKK